MSNTLKFGNGEWYGKEGTILAYNSENNNYKPLPFTFDRDSVATRVNKQGLIETVGSDQPRIDYLNDSNGALLLEPQRTNLVEYSEDFSNSWWNKQTFGTGVEASVITTTELAPDGSTNAFLVTLNSGSGTTPSDQARINRTIVGLSSGLDYTESIYLKGVNGGEQVLLGLSNIGTIKVTLTTEWKRFILSGTSGGSFNGVGVLIRRGLQEPLNSYAQFYMWGSQFEQGSYATSYIPTQGSAVTRLAETCNNGGNEQVINSTEGVLYFDGSALDDDGTDRKITLSDGSLNNAINFGFSRFSGNINAEVKSGGVLQTSGFGATGIAQDNNNKFALSWGGGVSKFYVNGTLASSDTNVTSPIGMNVLNFSLSSGFQKMYLNCKDIRVYDTALTDQELAALTQV
jgi:hypothetical protein